MLDFGHVSSHVSTNLLDDIIDLIDSQGISPSYIFPWCRIFILPALTEGIYITMLHCWSARHRILIHSVETIWCLWKCKRYNMMEHNTITNFARNPCPLFLQCNALCCNTMQSMHWSAGQKLKKGKYSPHVWVTAFLCTSKQWLTELQCCRQLQGRWGRVWTSAMWCFHRSRPIHLSV